MSSAAELVSGRLFMVDASVVLRRLVRRLKRFWRIGGDGSSGTPSPLILLLLTTVVVFVVEAAIMLVAFNQHGHGFLDALLVAGVTFAVAYVLMARPLARAIAALDRSEQRFRLLFEHAPMGIVVRDRRAGTVKVNVAFTQLTGYGAEQLPSCWETHLAGVETGADRRCQAKDGSDLWVRVHAAETGGEATGFAFALVEDVSERRAAEQVQRLANTVFHAAAEGMMLTDAERRIIAVNPAFTSVTGYAAAEVIGRDPRLLSSGRQDRAFYAEMWEAIHRDGRWSGDVWNRSKDGSVYVERLTISVVRDEAGTVTNYVGILSDVTSERREAERLARRANYDALTGLPNRTLLEDRLTHVIPKAERDARRFAVFFVDLDGFKPVNDTFGHLAGDGVLQEVARRLTAVVRRSDTVARLGGDEFIVLSLDVADIDGARALAEKMLDALRRPFHVDATPIGLGASIGIALYPEHGLDREALLLSADAAMYAAKQAGKNDFRLASGPLSGGAPVVSAPAEAPA